MDAIEPNPADKEIEPAVDSHGEIRTQIAALVPDLRGFARFLARDRAAADDLVQDALVRALAALHQFRPDSNLKAWLFAIVRNAFYENARRRKRETVGLPGHDPAALSTRPDAETRAEMRDLNAIIWSLPPLLREALILVGAQEMTYDEAALVCGVPVGTVKARVSRGRTALAAALRRADTQTNSPHDVADT